MLHEKKSIGIFIALNFLIAINRILNSSTLLHHHVNVRHNKQWSSPAIGNIGDDDITFHVKYNPDSLDHFGEMHLKRTFVEERTSTLSNTTSSTSTSISTSTSTLPRVLIAQYHYGSFNNSYAEIIKYSSKVNKAYAKKYNHDYLLAEGVFITTSSTSSSTPHQDGKNGKNEDNQGKVAAGSTSNKVGILEYALQHPTKQWDYVLILDSDAMMYDFERPIGDIYNMTNEVIIGHRVLRFTSTKTFNINAGVMLWNLRHAQTKQMVWNWHEEIRHVFETKVGEDQEALHTVLRRMPWRNRPVRAIRRDFEYAYGTVVKHFIRPGRKAVRKNWDDTKLKTEDRIEHMKATAEEICGRYKVYCDQVTAE